MLETGWDEDTLAGASRPLVGRLRHAIYARALATELTTNVDDELEKIRMDSLTSTSAQKRAAQKWRTEARNRLRSLARAQARIRGALHLDDPEPVPEDAE